jgi:hypothetical protein
MYSRHFRPRAVVPALIAGPLPPAPRAIETRHFSPGDLPDCIYVSNCCRWHLSASARAEAPIHRHVGPGSPTIGRVALVDGNVVGYILYVAREGSLELADIGCEPFYRRRTVATYLIRWLRTRLGASVRQPRTKIVATVPGSATDIQFFLQVQGFAAVPHHRGRCVGPDDSIRMVFDAEREMDTNCAETL